MPGHPDGVAGALLPRAIGKGLRSSQIWGCWVPTPLLSDLAGPDCPLHAKDDEGRHGVPRWLSSATGLKSDPLTGFLHQQAHVADRLGQAVEGGATYDGVADVELIELGDGGDGLDVVVVQAVAGIDL